MVFRGGNGGVPLQLTTKWRTILASAHALCLNLLLYMWLCISGGLNCCQKFRREVVYRLIGVRIEHVKDIKDVNL